MRVLCTRAISLYLTLFSGLVVRGQHPSAQHVLDKTLRGTGAAALLLDAADGRLLATYGPVDAASAPGSTLKPMVLQTALAAHLLTDRTTVLCRGNLVIGGHNLACTHARDILRMDARLALSNSCNMYFATLAERMPESLLLRGLRSYGLASSTQATAPEQRALLALGVEGIRVTPRQLASSYRRLALQFRAEDAVRDGLLESVDTGMAHAAHIDGLPAGVRLGGKTGTMHDSADPLGHGWFAGIVFRGTTAQEVLILCLPRGNGADAARLAQRILAEQLVLKVAPTGDISR